MDWEKRFSSIFKETESNLAKVKERLDASKNLTALSHSFHESSFSTDKLEADSSRFAHSLQLQSSPLKPLIAPTWSGQTGLSPQPYTINSTQAEEHRAEGSSLLLEQSPGLITLLNDKIEAQNRAIEALTQAVRNLEEEKHMYSQQVTRLKDDISQLTARVAERGVDLQTERKVEQWKQEVMAQMQLMHTQLSLNKQTNLMHGDNQVTAMLKELQEFKKFMREECGELRNGVENLKSRMVLMEVDVHQSHADNKGLMHRQEVLDRSFRDVVNTQTTASRGLSAVLGQTRDRADTEIAQLRSSLRYMDDKLKAVESKVQKDHATISVKTKLKSSKKPNKDQVDKAGNESPDLSEVELDLTPDFSDLSTPDDGRKSAFGEYEDFTLADLSPDEMSANDLDDLKTRDLEDIKTADSFDFNLTVDDLQSGAGDLDRSDQDLSIDHLV